MLLAKTAPKLYNGAAVCEPSANECVTWKMGLTDRLFDKSALAPSKKKFVNNVPKTSLR